MMNTAERLHNYCDNMLTVLKEYGFPFQFVTLDTAGTFTHYQLPRTAQEIRKMHQASEIPFPTNEEIAKCLFDDDVREKARAERCREERMQEFEGWINHIIELYE